MDFGDFLVWTLKGVLLLCLVGMFVCLILAVWTLPIPVWVKVFLAAVIASFCAATVLLIVMIDTNRV